MSGAGERLPPLHETALEAAGALAECLEQLREPDAIRRLLELVAQVIGGVAPEAMRELEGRFSVTVTPTTPDRPEAMHGAWQRLRSALNRGDLRAARNALGELDAWIGRDVARRTPH